MRATFFTILLLVATSVLAGPSSYLFRKGVEAYKAKDYDTALDFFYRELSENGENGFAYGYIAEIYLEKNQLSQASFAIQNALKLIPKNDKSSTANAYSTRACISLQQNDTTAALNDLTTAIDLYPEKYDFYYSRGRIYANQGKYDLSNNDYKAMIELGSGDGPFWGLYLLASNAIEQEKYDEAVSYATTALSKYTSSKYSAFYIRAVAYIRLKKYSQAADDVISAYGQNSSVRSLIECVDILADSVLDVIEDKVKKQIAREPHAVKWQNLLGETYFSANKYLAAVNAFKKGLRFDKSPFANYRIACLYATLGLFNQAIEFYDKAYALDPSASIILLDKALCLEECGRTADAIKIYNNLANYYQNDPEFLEDRAHCEMAALHFDKATTYYSAAIDLNPFTTSNFLYRGHSYKLRGITDGAISDFQVAAQSPNVTIAAIALYALDKKDKALDMIEQLTQSDKEYDIYEAACFYAAINDVPNALNFLHQALELGFDNFRQIRRQTEFLKIRNSKEFTDIIDEFLFADTPKPADLPTTPLGPSL